jgi:hypothetical protein
VPGTQVTPERVHFRHASLLWPFHARQSVFARCYYPQERLDLEPGNAWFDSGLGLISPDGAATSRTTADTNAPMRFYRVQAVRPLAP